MEKVIIFDMLDPGIMPAAEFIATYRTTPWIPFSLREFDYEDQVPLDQIEDNEVLKNIAVSLVKSAKISEYIKEDGTVVVLDLVGTALNDGANFIFKYHDEHTVHFQILDNGVTAGLILDGEQRDAYRCREMLVVRSE